MIIILKDETGNVVCAAQKHELLSCMRRIGEILRYDPVVRRGTAPPTRQAAGCCCSPAKLEAQQVSNQASKAWRGQDDEEIMEDHGNGERERAEAAADRPTADEFNAWDLA
jgi:hypothetical protein